PRTGQLHRPGNTEAADQNQRLPQFLRASSHRRHRILRQCPESRRTASALLPAFAWRQSECRWGAVWTPDYVRPRTAHPRDYSRTAGVLSGGPASGGNIFRVGVAYAGQRHQGKASPLGRSYQRYRGSLRGLGRYGNLFLETRPRGVRGMSAKVYLVGAGPGDPGLLTLKAVRSLGAAAAAGISLTDRRVASQILFTTFSRGSDGSVMDWGCVTSTTTLVLYMPGADYVEVSERLLAGGLPADLPCVVVSRASGSEQQLRWSSVGRLASEERLPAPALLIVGRVASRDVGGISASFWDRNRTDSTGEPRSVS